MCVGSQHLHLDCGDCLLAASVQMASVCKARSGSFPGRDRRLPGRETVVLPLHREARPGRVDCNWEVSARRRADGTRFAQEGTGKHSASRSDGPGESCCSRA